MYTNQGTDGGNILLTFNFGVDSVDTSDTVKVQAPV